MQDAELHPMASWELMQPLKLDYQPFRNVGHLYGSGGLNNLITFSWNHFEIWIDFYIGCAQVITVYFGGVTEWSLTVFEQATVLKLSATYHNLGAA